MLQVVQNWCLANNIPFEAVVLFLGGLTGAIVLYMFDNNYLNLPCVRKKRMKNSKNRRCWKHSNKQLKNKVGLWNLLLKVLSWENNRFHQELELTVEPPVLPSATTLKF